MKPLLMSVTCNRKAPSKVLNLFKDASAQLKEAFKNASWQEKQKDSLLEHKTANIVRLKKEEREGNLELEQLEQELEGLREEMRLLEVEEKALRRMELTRKGSVVGEGVDRNLHSRNLNNSESFKGRYFHEGSTSADSSGPHIQRKTSGLKGESKIMEGGGFKAGYTDGLDLPWKRNASGRGMSKGEGSSYPGGRFLGLGPERF